MPHNWIAGMSRRSAKFGLDFSSDALKGACNTTRTGFAVTMPQLKSIRAFNLNALPVLREILRHGSVSKAAKELNVSQPALSATLKQLRHHFGDELLVRTASGMKLTRKAQALSLELEQALTALERVLRGSEASLQRTLFTIATTDHIISRFALPLVQQIDTAGHPIRANFVITGLHSVEQLGAGVIDMVIAPRSTILTAGAQKKLLSEVVTESLFEERFVAIGPASDARLRSPLSIDQYLHYPHVSFSVDPNNPVSAEAVYLASHSYIQNDIMQVATHALLPDLAVALNAIALLPEAIAISAAARLPLQVFEPPIRFPPWDWVAIWHRRSKDNPNLANVLGALRTIMSQR